MIVTVALTNLLEGQRVLPKVWLLKQLKISLEFTFEEPRTDIFERLDIYTTAATEVLLEVPCGPGGEELVRNRVRVRDIPRIAGRQ